MGLLVGIAADHVFEIQHNVYVQLNNSNTPELPQKFTLCLSFLPTQLVEIEEEAFMLYMDPLEIGMKFTIQDSKPMIAPSMTLIDSPYKIDIPIIENIKKDKWNSICLTVDTDNGLLGKLCLMHATIHRTRPVLCNPGDSQSSLFLEQNPRDADYPAL